MVIPRLTFERAREAFHYSVITGELFWKIRGARRRAIGAVAGAMNVQGYVQIQIDKEVLLAHRLIYFWLYGEWPEETIDHENRIKSDNRWLNLREVSYTKNNQNVLRRERHMAGVYRDTRKGIIFSKIVVDGKAIPLGTFKTEREANAAYVKASLEHFG